MKYDAAAVDSPAITSFALSLYRSAIFPQRRFCPNADAVMSSVPSNAVYVTVFIRLKM